MTLCAQPACGGSIDADGYCDRCGTKFQAAPAAVAASPLSNRTPTIGAPVAPSQRTRGTAAGSSRRTGSTRRRTSVLGAGLVEVSPTPAGDPALAIMSDAAVQAVIGEVPEDRRNCTSCGRPVGRATAERPGRLKGFCGNCRSPFDFTLNAPGLSKGELVGDQYEVLGCLAHGGMGWIYLARDTAVSNRWVVLKGLLSSSDPDAIASAVAERQYLARVEHGNIVRIYNFVAWRGQGYIVMEYVGGESLNSKLKKRRAANGGKPDPLPVADALAYILATLPALAHLHTLGLLYNDLKPANVMAVGDDVKLIDLGGVIRADDTDAAVFGTQGFQGPEVTQHGVSIASDIYTVGRTLAVLVLNFVFHEGPYQYALPAPADEPLFARHESLYRLLLRATATEPAERFESCEAIAEQVMGVLREVVSLADGRPRPAPSRHFSGDQLGNLFAEYGEQLDVNALDSRTLPRVEIDPADPNAAMVALLPAWRPAEALRLVDAAIAQGAPESVELHLARASALIGTGGDPSASIELVAAANPWDFRVDWFKGLAALSKGQHAAAGEAFSRVATELPGETAPRLAMALCAEAAGEFERASDLYRRVATVDDTYVSALFGLARCRRAADDQAGSVAAYETVPTTSAVYIDAQIAATRARLNHPQLQPIDLTAAEETVGRLLLDPKTRAQLQAEVLERALAGLPTVAPTSAGARLFGRALNETDLRLGLEAAYRSWARATDDRDERIRLVDRANAARPRTLV